jgi:outer membrane immunogenic protein
MRVQLAALLLAASALTPVSAMAAPTTDWTGPYIGVNGAGDLTDVGMSGTAQVNQLSGIFWPGRGVIIVPGTTVSFPSDQFHTATVTTDRKTATEFGGQAGYDWQFGRFVAGIEGDVDATNHAQTTTTVRTTLPTTAVSPPTSVTLQRTLRSDTPWSVRARLGAAWGSTLVYATGGVAGARVKASNMDTFFDPGGLGAGCGNADPATCLALLGPLGPVNLGPSGPTVTAAAFSATRIGWTAGGGVEEKFGHLSVALEYRHTDLGTFIYGGLQPIVSQGAVVINPHGNSPSFQPDVGASLTRATLRDDAVSVRLNYRF